MKRTISLVLCGFIFVAALAAVGMAVSVSATEQKTPLTGFGGKPAPSNLPDLFPSTNPQPAVKGPWLPDPCNVFGVSGRYMKSQKFSGTNVKYYSYELDATMDEIGHLVSNYTWALWENLDYEICQLTVTGDLIDALGLRKDGEMAELYLRIIDDSYYDSCGILSWELILVVPETMEFQLGRKTPGIINGENACPSCEGSKKCAFCHGTGRYNYGAGYETCVNCDGTKVCSICGGVGY